MVADSYSRFEIRASHSLRQPDEAINPATLLPLFPLSGLDPTYTSNLLDPTNDPQRIVHPRARGYAVNPADRFLSSTIPPVAMMPYPLNRGLPVAEHQFYTWRDTALQAKGAPFGTGAELGIVVQVTGVGTAGVPYGPSNVPSIGLPLLMEFRCFPESDALGLNSFDVNIALNSSPQPYFRAFSTGGMDAASHAVIKDPDLEPIATGGFNPTSIPPGAPTPGVDNTFYIGQMDLITRISRAHSIWLDTTSASVAYSTPVVEPKAADLPLGTALQLAFRGATGVTGAAALDASTLDAYGDASSGTVTFLNNDKTWKASLASLNGERFYQVRVTFVSNAETLLSPKLSALGFAFRR